MICKDRKNIFNYFEVSKCDRCDYYLEDYSILVGSNYIYVYYINKCVLNEYDSELLFGFDKKVRLFIKDAIINQDKINVLIIEGNLIDKLHNENCAICLNNFNEGEHISYLPCFHEYHSKCIKKWLKETVGFEITYYDGLVFIIERC